jgi:hypothetical protein
MVSSLRKFLSGRSRKNWIWRSFETNTADYWKQKQQEHSSDEYVDDTPEAYGWVNAEVQLSSNNLQRKPEGWGDVDAAL